LQNIIKSERQSKALQYAIDQIKQSPICPFVSELYLYGSCARNEEKFDSDVDLLLELHDDFPVDSPLRIDLVRLRSNVSSGDIDDPETDLKVVIGNTWKDNKMWYYRNVRKEGKKIWH